MNYITGWMEYITFYYLHQPIMHGQLIKSYKLQPWAIYYPI
jgi:hypothetical protein